MRKVSYTGAINEALLEEMERDERVFVMGEDVSWNILGTTGGLVEKFGEERVRDTPITESGFVGAGAGAAMVGMRPVVDMLIAPFIYVAFDQIVSIIAKSTYIYGGQASIPIVLRLPMMYGVGNAGQHSDRPYPTLMTIPGLKIVAPTTAYDAKGLMKTAIRDNDPVMFVDDITLWNSKSEIPDEDYTVPLGKAAIRREGDDVTIVGVTGAVALAMLAAEELANEGISAEVIDLRSIVPMDYDTVLASVEKTGYLVVVDPAHTMGSVASELSAVVAQEGFQSLKGPIQRVTTPHSHIPYSANLERSMYPSKDGIKSAVGQAMA